MSKGYLKGWIAIRLFVVLCLLTQTVVPVIAQEPIPLEEEEPELPPADPADLIVPPWEDNGLDPAMPLDPATVQEPAFTLPEQASSVAELIPPDFVSFAATQSEFATDTAETAVVTSVDSAISFLDGQVTLVAEAGAFGEDVTVSLQPITAAGVISKSYSILDSEGKPITVTQTSHEFVRFQLEATSLASDQPIETFDKTVHLVVDVRGMADVTPGPNWYIAYQDEEEPSIWYHPNVAIHDENGLISVSTDHFSGWSAGNLPSAWRYRWNLPTVSTFSGAATFQYPIEVPAGRGGLTPNIDISYSSRGLDGLIFTDDMDQGPLGLGWGINNIEISRANIDFYDDGARIHLKHGDRFSLVLNGASHELRRYGGNGSTYADYYAVNAPGLRVQQVYNRTHKIQMMSIGR
jgi:hypothetical protein